MAIANSTLTVEELRKHVEYDPSTGVFTRLNSIHGNPLRKEIRGPNSNGYTTFTICGRKEYAHRMAWLWVHGVQPTYGIDHINGVKTDNRICNLRDVPQSINLQNRVQKSVNKISNLRCVRPSDNRWSSRITINGKEIRLGTFDTKEEAYLAYLSARKIMHPGAILT